MKTYSRSAIFTSTILAGMLVTGGAVISKTTNAAEQSAVANQVTNTTTALIWAD